MMKRLVIFGAGGHGVVVAETALLLNYWDEIAFYDDSWPNISHSIGYKIVGSAAELITNNDYGDLIVAVGNNSIRAKLQEKFHDLGFNIVSVVHPNAVISKSAKIGKGVAIMAGVIINANAVISDGCIINSGAVIEHDCKIGRYAHLSPRAAIAGNVSIGKLTWVGIGSSVIQSLVIGSGVIIGAGAVVISNVENNKTVVGVPARVLN